MAEPELSGLSFQDSHWLYSLKPFITERAFIALKTAIIEAKQKITSEDKASARRLAELLTDVVLTKDLNKR